MFPRLLDESVLQLTVKLKKRESLFKQPDTNKQFGQLVLRLEIKMVFDYLHHALNIMGYSFDASTLEDKEAMRIRLKDDRLSLMRMDTFINSLLEKSKLCAFAGINGGQLRKMKHRAADLIMLVDEKISCLSQVRGLRFMKQQASDIFPEPMINVFRELNQVLLRRHDVYNEGKSKVTFNQTQRAFLKKCADALSCLDSSLSVMHYVLENSEASSADSFAKAQVHNLSCLFIVELTLSKMLNYKNRHLQANFNYSQQKLSALKDKVQGVRQNLLELIESKYALRRKNVIKKSSVSTPRGLQRSRSASQPASQSVQVVRTSRSSSL